MSLEISLLYLEKEEPAREVAKKVLLRKGFKVKVYESFKNALRLTNIKECNIIIAHIDLKEYASLAEYARKEKIPLILAPSSKVIYETQFKFRKIIQDYDIPLVEGDWYNTIKPEDLMSFLKKNQKP